MLSYTSSSKGGKSTIRKSKYLSPLNVGGKTKEISNHPQFQATHLKKNFISDSLRNGMTSDHTCFLSLLSMARKFSFIGKINSYIRSSD